MKAITVRQPWASLITAGVKTIETRPRRTGYRGRIAIHAGLHRPPHMHLPPLSRRRDDHAADRQTWLVIDTITDPAFQGPQRQGRRLPKRATSPTLFYPHEGPHGRRWDETAGTSATEQGSAILLPLGAVVASAVLTDCVPMVAECDLSAHRGGTNPLIAIANPDLHGSLATWLSYVPNAVSPGRYIDKDRSESLRSQLPFGDFTPGRWALLLDDIAPTTDRCPWCWGNSVIQTAAIGEQVVSCPSCGVDRWHGYGPCSTCGAAGTASECPACHGAGRCDPIPARGQQAVPWEWTP